MVPISFTLGQVDVAPIQGALDRAEDLSPAMAAIAEYMLSETQTRFETSTAPDGTFWPPSRRVIEGGNSHKGGQTLIKTGHLLSSLTTAHDATSAEVGTQVPYANIHNSGGTIRGKERADGSRGPLNTPFGYRASVKMPKRQFIGFSDADNSEIPALLGDYLMGLAA